MATVVVLSWEDTTGILVYVPVNAGSGGDATQVVVPPSAPEVAVECQRATLPRVGELVIDGGECLLELSGPAVTVCSARWRRPSVRLRSRTGGEVLAELPPADVGLPDDPDLVAQVEHIGPFLFFEQPDTDGVRGCWQCEGGLAGWLERRAQRRAERETEQAARKAKAEADKQFINPYTFVPFPEMIERDRPAGHQALRAGRLSGTFRVAFEFTSPMQAPENAASGQRLRLAGASVKGAVRSLHETLAGGCLRVLDEDFVPSYRDTAAVPAAEWTLAVVESVTRDGQPLTVRLCDPVVWVRAEQLRAACGRHLATGSRVSFTPPTEPTSLQRFELAADAPVRRGGDWVVLLSDAGARRPETKLKKPGSYFAACGRLDDTSPLCEVQEDAWRDFRRAVADAREVTQRRAAERTGETMPPTVAVRFRDEEIGRRKTVTDRLTVGDVLWAKRGPAGGGVVGLRMAAIWRHAGAGPLGARVPERLRACPSQPATESSRPADGDWDEQLLLCPSCRLFGAAETRARSSDERAQQRAYAGHVRFGDAVSPDPVQLTLVRRAPMGTPRPGAGQFYLRCDDPSPAGEADAPTREWGARPDQRGAPRPVRGRKFYWHADPTRQPVPRYLARDHQTNARMLVQRQLAPAGTVLEAVVTFDNLSEAELGGLLATLDPSQVLPTEGRPVRLRLGGGKPLGLGSCRATVTELQVWSARSRYGDAEPVTPEPARYVAAFTAQVPAAVSATWPALTAALAEDTVDPARVWYPPGAYWSQQRDDPKGFDEPFAFFLGTSGMYLAEAAPRPLKPLPDPTETSQALPIIRKQDLGKGQEGD
jgi:hypothetical protein